MRTGYARSCKPWDESVQATFSFGRNWKNYVQSAVDDSTLARARESLLRFLPEADYRGKRFIDVGCGSGLFSLSACLLGCAVVSFDVDAHSLEAVELLKSKLEHRLPAKYQWTIFRGSILDDGLAARLRAQAEIVYAWGVLHHTGNMWKGIENTAGLVQSGGYLILAIYNYAPSSEFWLSIKKFYNTHTRLQPILAGLYTAFATTGYMVKHRTVRLARQRGMNVYYDARDWIGGYPYEFACFDQVKDFVQARGFDLQRAPTCLPCGKGQATSILEKLTAGNTGCNEFVFQKNL